MDKKSRVDGCTTFKRGSIDMNDDVCEVYCEQLKEMSENMSKEQLEGSYVLLSLLLSSFMGQIRSIESLEYSDSDPEMSFLQVRSVAINSLNKVVDAINDINNVKESPKGI